MDGLDDPVGAVSTVLTVAVMHAIISETASVMVARGQTPHVEVNPLPREGSAGEQNDAPYAELWRRLSSR